MATIGKLDSIHLEGYDSDDPNILENKLHELVLENENLKSQLTEEKLKWLQIEDRYNYLEKNYIEFSGLKDEYMKLTNDRLKMNATTNCSNKSTQTWDNIICEFCRSTEYIASQESFKKFIECQKEESVCIKKDYLIDLQEKFNELKLKIQEMELRSRNNSELLEIAKLKGINSKCKSVMRELLSKYKQERNTTKLLKRIVAGYKTDQKFNLQEELFIHNIKSDLITPKLNESKSDDQISVETEKIDEDFISELNHELFEPIVPESIESME